MKQQTKSTPNENANTANSKQHNYLRTALAGVFGSVALLLVVASLLLVWFNRTLTNTDVYVSTVAPLANKPAVQNFITENLSGEISKAVPAKELSAILLDKNVLATEDSSKLGDLAKTSLKKQVKSVVESEKFYNVWENSNRSIHRSLIAQLDSDSKKVKLNLKPVFVGVSSLLKDTSLGPYVGKINLPNNKTLIVIKGDNLSRIQNIYSNLKRLALIIVILSVLFIVLSVIFSTHHAKTLRRIALFSGIALLLFWLGLIITPGLTTLSADTATKQLVNDLSGTLLRTLTNTTLVLGSVFVLGALASKLYAHIKSKKV